MQKRPRIEVVAIDGEILREVLANAIEPLLLSLRECTFLR
jgi:hypothetical protein